MVFERFRFALILSLALMFATVPVLFSAEAVSATAGSSKEKDKAVVGTQTSDLEVPAESKPATNPNLAPPNVKRGKSAEGLEPQFTPEAMPNIKFPEQVGPTPTPEPGVLPKDPTAAALFSVIVPGLGHVYSGEPLKGIFFAGAFGLTLWQSLENFKLEDEPGSDERVAKNETAGSLYGLAALAAYGFSVQDAFNSAKRFNRRHYLSVSFTVNPSLPPLCVIRFNAGPRRERFLPPGKPEGRVDHSEDPSLEGNLVGSPMDGFSCGRVPFSPAFFGGSCPHLRSLSLLSSPFRPFND